MKTMLLNCGSTADHQKRLPALIAKVLETIMLDEVGLPSSDWIKQHIEGCDSISFSYKTIEDGEIRIKFTLQVDETTRNYFNENKIGTYFKSNFVINKTLTEHIFDHRVLRPINCVLSRVFYIPHDSDDNSSHNALNKLFKNYNDVVDFVFDIDGIHRNNAANPIVLINFHEEGKLFLSNFENTDSLLLRDGKLTVCTIPEFQ